MVSVSTTSKPARAQNSSRSSVSSVNSTRSISSKQPKRPAPSAQLNATKVVSSNEVKAASVKKTLQPLSKAHSQLKLNMRPGEFKTSVRKKNDPKEVQQRDESRSWKGNAFINRCSCQELRGES